MQSLLRGPLDQSLTNINHLKVFLDILLPSASDSWTSLAGVTLSRILVRRSHLYTKIRLRGNVELSVFVFPPFILEQPTPSTNNVI